MIYRIGNVIATPPGETIKEQLEFHGMSLNDFSKRMGVTEFEALRILEGDAEITYAIALKLEGIFGISRRFLVNLESLYHEKLRLINPQVNGLL